MDFGTLLSVAQKNENNKTTTACYQTKFTPPKKQSKQSKTLSENIKKFLARKEEEERQKALEEKRKRENLLALRDHKAQSRINKHLKVCKAANKSVLADAIDNENTAVTMAGPSQPDEDDYGYVSQEASAFYNQLMNKYNNLPAEKPLFSDAGKKTVKDIASTKDRVRQALKQQETDESSNYRRRRKTTVNGKEIESDSKTEKDITERNEKTEKSKDSDKNDKPKPKKKPPPPPIDFQELLKLAEKKQHEPIVIEPKPKPKVEEPERLMTKKQMKEYMKEKEWRERKEQRKSQDLKPNEVPKKSSSVSEPTKPASTPQFNKIPKLGEKIPVKTPANSLASKNTSKPASAPLKKPTEKVAAPSERNSVTDKSSSARKESLNKNDLLNERKKLEEERRQLEEMRRAIEEEKKKLAQSKIKKVDDTKSQSKPVNKTISKPNGLSKPEIKDIKPRQFPPADLKPKHSSLTNDAPKQFPPPDVRPLKRKSNGKDLKRPHKRRIIDDDDEEYDSELADFIDDGPEEESEDYSKYISEIFGYDKSKYRYVDDEDDAAMESNFAQQLKEEYVSTKIGIMEDLEDIRKEALEKKRKALMKKKSRK